MTDNSIQLDSGGSYLFVGNSYTFGRVDPVMSYNSDHVRDLTAPVPGTTFANTSGSNPYEPHPWGGVPGLFQAFADQAGLELDVAISARNAATLQGQYLNSNPAGWDLRGNVASQAWDVVVLQDNSTQALPSGTGSITFAAGSSTATLTIHPTTDTKVETDETVGIQITSDPTYRTSSGVVSGTILNDDPTGPVVNPALPTVTLVASPGAVLEDGTDKLVYTFTRTGPTTSAMTVNFTAFRDGSTAPSVASGGDFENNANQFTNSFQADTGVATTGNVSFTSNTGSVVIPAGATSVTFTLDPRPDATVENDESIRLTLSANANYNVGTQGAVSATILNDDFAAGTDLSLPNISLNLAASAIYEDSSGDLVYVFTRTGSNAAPLTVKFGVSGTATLPGNDFTVTGADSFMTSGAADPNLQSFNTYAVKLAQYAITGAADGAIPANAHANAATDVYLYETWARPNMVTGAIVANTDDTTGAVTNTTTTAPEYYQSLETMTADLRAAYEGLAASNPIFAGVAPVGAAFLAAVQNGTALRDPYAPDAGADGKVDLWWDDNLHASKYGSYLSGLTLFGTLTGLDPRSLGAAEHVASDLGIDPAVAAALQNVAAATLGFTLNANWTAPGQVTELQGGVTGLLATAGSFGFSDSDAADAHTVTVAPLTPGSIGTFTAALHTDTTGDGSGGAVNWQFTVDNAAVASLAPGATRVEHFLVTISDANGGQAQRDIAVTINGTFNDAPVNTMPAGPLSTPGGVDYAIVGLSVSDVDSPQLTTTLHVDHGTLTVAAIGGVTVSGSGTGTVLLTGSAAQIDASLGAANNVIYHGALDFSGTDLLSMTSDDGGGAGGTTVNTVPLALSNHPGLFTAGDDSVTLPGAGSYVALGGNDTITMLATGEIAYGGTGNDTYHVEATGNTVVEFAGEGNDTVVTSLLASYTLGANVENLVHTGHGDFVSIGNQLNNQLIGGDGNNYLIGLGGNDVLISNGGLTTLQGGAGNDVYAVQYATDSVFEFANEGTDQVQTFLSAYHLGPNVENLTFVGSGPHTGIGNELNNVLIGGDGYNYLIGLDGNDVLISNGLTALQGGAGDDTYAVQYVTDSVTEFANEGTDQVQTFLSSYTLTPNVENLTFVGAFSHNGTGNELANTFTGSSASDTFTGAGGNDVFNYRVSGNGLDIITDFNADNANTAEHDHIDLTGRGLNFAALAITTDVDGITIGIPGGDAIHLKGVAAHSLDAGDFFF